jgi:hypothetical protein
MDDLIKALPKLLRAAGESEEVSEAAAFVAWRRVAGETLRGCAVPFRLYRKTLVVSVPDVTWRKQLEAVSSQLIFRVNSVVGQALVTFIEFRVDPKTVQAERERLRSAAGGPSIHEESALRRAEEIGDAAEAIRDEGLRRRFLVAAGSCLERSDR